MDNGTFFCGVCHLRIAKPRSEHMEADHGRCGNRGCERKLVSGACPQCDDGPEPDSNRVLGL
jgi:hypothetical protein